jgi:hypothetical protein
MALAINWALAIDWGVPKNKYCNSSKLNTFLKLALGFILEEIR